MSKFRKYMLWFGGALGFVLSWADRIADIIGKSTTPEDAGGLLVKIGHFLDWVTSQNPVWVPALGTLLLLACAILIYRDIVSARKFGAVSVLDNNQPDGIVRSHQHKDNSSSWQEIYRKRDRLKISEAASLLAGVPPENPLTNQSAIGFAEAIRDGMKAESELSPSKLYVGQILVSSNRLSELFLEFAIRFGNYSGGSIQLQDVSGTIGLRSPVWQFEPPPVLIVPKIGSRVENESEGTIALEVRIASELVPKVREALRTQNGISANFSKLAVKFGRTGDDKPISLPIWKEITIRSLDDTPVVGRVFEATATTRLRS